MDHLFTYEPLRGKRTIRLLSIQPGEASEPLSCECISYSLDNEHSNSFEAVSYTWGVSTNTRHIMIDGCNFPVGTNAFDVLISMRLKNESRLVWIDAICINQEDNDEKAQQLPLMREIYSTAKSVYAWLGKPSDDIGFAMSLLRDLKELYTMYTQDLESPVPPYPGGLHGIGMDSVFQYTGTFLESHGWRALRAFLKRPWFRRIWVYQEVVLARDLQLVCGKYSIDFQNFAPIIHWLMYCDAHPILHHRDDPRERGVISKPDSGLMHLSRMHETRYNMSVEKKMLAIEDHLCEAVHWAATEPRDMVYAILGIVDETIAKEIKPDYYKPVAEIYTEAAKLAIQSKSSLRIISVAGVGLSGSVEGLPTWVPDYTAFRPYVPIGMLGESTLHTEKIPQMNVRFEGSRLVARGLKMGIVEATGRVNDKAALMEDWRERNTEYVTYRVPVRRSLKSSHFQNFTDPAPG
jgi:hypothetical protein